MRWMRCWSVLSFVCVTLYNQVWWAGFLGVLCLGPVPLLWVWKSAHTVCQREYLVKITCSIIHHICRFTNGFNICVLELQNQEGRCYKTTNPHSQIKPEVELFSMTQMQASTHDFYLWPDPGFVFVSDPWTYVLCFDAFLFLLFSFLPHSPAVRAQGDRGGVWCTHAEESHAERPGGSCKLSSVHCTGRSEYCMSRFCFILTKRRDSTPPRKKWREGKGWGVGREKNVRKCVTNAQMETKE